MDLSGRPLTASSTDQMLFVDRQDELTLAVRSIEARANLVVVGERGSGKTSFLHALEAKAPDNRRTIFVDGALATTATELLTLVRYRIDPRSMEEATRLGTPWTRNLTESQAPASTSALNILDELRKTLARRSQSYLVMVDELLDREIGHALFGRLRDEVWQLPITWVVAASPRDLIALRRPPADAFFGRALELAPLTERAARALLLARTGRGALPAPLLRTIVEAANGNPRQLLHLASETIIAGDDPERLVRDEEQRSRVVGGLSETAQRVVAELQATGPASASDSSFLDRLGLTRSRVTQVFKELEAAGVVSAQSNVGPSGRSRRMYSLL